MAASLTGTFGHATGTQDAGRPHRCRHDRATQLVPAGDAPAAARDKRCPPLPRWQERDAVSRFDAAGYGLIDDPSLSRYLANRDDLIRDLRQRIHP